MRYYSTNGKEICVSLQEAVTRSQASDGGVYMPEAIPLIPKALFNNIAEMSLTDIAYIVGTSLFGSDIEPELINEIVKDTLNFDIPIVKTNDHTYALELFHGPTKSFKDVGARFMARVTDYFLKKEGPTTQKLNVLVSTSGDTGNAVADAFAGISNVRVFIFHPKGKYMRVSSNINAVGYSNIIPVEVRGSFDDCQALVRQAYEDKELSRKLRLTSANSINIARLIPQTFYYFYAYARLVALGENPTKIAIATPCGNLGNLTAALFAKQMGLPINRIMAAGYGSERLWGEIKNGILSVSTFNNRALSTNLSRINNLIQNNAHLAALIDCHTYNDDDISAQMHLTYATTSYVMDRNSAMACRAIEQNRQPDEVGVFLATAHPSRSAEMLEKTLGLTFPHNRIPENSKPEKHAVTIAAYYPALKRFLLDLKH